VSGYVRDSAGRPMADVPVVVVSKNGETIMDTQYFNTDSEGFYSVTIGDRQWDIGWTVTSTATANGEQASVTVTVTEEMEFGVTIDLQFEFEIPQFGTTLGFLAAAAIVAIVAVFLLPKRRNK